MYYKERNSNKGSYLFIVKSETIWNVESRQTISAVTLKKCVL